MFFLSPILSSVCPSIFFTLGNFTRFEGRSRLMTTALPVFAGFYTCCKNKQTSIKIELEGQKGEL